MLFNFKHIQLINEINKAKAGIMEVKGGLEVVVKV
jgi:hypothetical protein